MRTGNQTPRICIEPDACRSDGDDAILLMSAYGYSLDLWQKNILTCWLGQTASGDYAAATAGLSVPRQNGKNATIEAREFYGMVVRREKILHTAHQTRTSKRSFRRLEAMFTDRRHPEVCTLVKDIRYTNGEEAIELTNGGRIEFSTRTRQSARGFDGIGLIVYDEAQELTDDQVEATMATLAASATNSRQIIYAGTPPYPGCPGTVLRRIRSACMSGEMPDASWHEWSIDADGIDAIDVNDVNAWYLTNPALGIRLSEDFTRNELKTLSKDGFARERLGWWPPVATVQNEYVLDATRWESCRSMEKKPDGKTAYGVKFNVDGTEVVLCGAVIPTDGPARISLIRRESMSRGVQWLADWLNERYVKASCVVIDGKNGADVLIDKISPVWRAKDCIVRCGSKQVLAAVGTLTAAVNEQKLTWYFGQEDLNNSATSSVKRPFSGGFGFGGENSAPIEAASLALWGAQTAKRNPNKEMMIG